jgi:3-oxoacyl-[acyl-carrier protein] reductase
VDAPVDQTTDAQWRGTVAVNLDSASLVRHSVAQMKKQRAGRRQSGHIVLVSSTAGQRGEAFTRLCRD